MQFQGRSKFAQSIVTGCHILALTLFIATSLPTASAQDAWQSRTPGTNFPPVRGANLGQGTSTWTPNTQTNQQAGSNYVPVAQLPSSPAASPTAPFPQTTAAPQAHVARVESGAETLPRTAGQVWRTYDISPFTRRFSPEEKPQQEIIDWILRDTGTDLWFGDPLGILSADYDRLHVYHTPAVQALIHSMVDRFVDPRSQSHVLTFRMVQVSSPAWRAQFIPLGQMAAVDVRSEGVQGWLMSKEAASVLIGELRRRPDFTELQGQNLYLPSGRTEVLTRTQPIDYLAGLAVGQSGYLENIRRTVNEGFSLEMSALKDFDQTHMEAVVKCNINQIEKLVDVPLQLRAANGGTQTVTIQVPQLVTWRLHERFKWPLNQVLVLSCGVVATPVGDRRQTLLPALATRSERADALLFLEVMPTNESTILPGNGASGAVPSAARPGVMTYGRY